MHFLTQLGYFNYDCHSLIFLANYNYPLKVRVSKEVADRTYTAQMCQIILQAEKLTKNEQYALSVNLAGGMVLSAPDWNQISSTGAAPALGIAC